jgi:hypothetical protein
MTRPNDQLRISEMKQLQKRGRGGFDDCGHCENKEDARDQHGRVWIGLERQTMTVFMLWHGYPTLGKETATKLLGVFSSLENARATQVRAVAQPGFREWPDCFEITECAVDQEEWIEGFATVPRKGHRWIVKHGAF